MDTAMGQGPKDDAAAVAKAGFDAMMSGRGDVVSGWKNKLATTHSAITPSGLRQSSTERSRSRNERVRAAFRGPVASKGAQPLISCPN